MRNDTDSWAKPVSRIGAVDAPAGTMNANVAGRRLSGATGGFGQMWQKTFRVRLVGVVTTPAEVVRTWKERYAELWPTDQHMYLAGAIAPGSVGLINATMPGAPTMATGILVVYADDESFSFMTPQGHPFTGMITFSAHDDDGVTVAQVQELVRSSDPMWELLMATFLGRKQNDIWRVTLSNLATLFSVAAPVEATIVCVDRRRQWGNAKNIWHNAGIRSAMTAPLRWARRASR